jgi:hypothetical protein
VVTACTIERPTKQGIKCAREVTSIIFVRPRPIPTPKSVDAVNYETAFPWMSARLLFLANLRLMLALDAEDSMKQMFLPQFAIDAIIKKYCGKMSVETSIQRAAFRTKMERNLHFLMSASKFLPYLEAKSIAPS